ncbi:MAG: hypothetical protein GY832_17970 [Chloroflexi bacterium]|nr:hypothetical protein [Chloroflexota bacterium]
MSWTRNIAKLIRRMIDRALADVHTHMPAQVISYDAATNLAVVQPCLNRIRVKDPNNETTVQLPVIEDVPVKQFGSGKCLITIAPQADSYGVLHVSERSLEKWVTEGGIVNPGSTRKFDISDGFFDPGTYPTVDDGDNGLISPAIATDRIALRTRDNTAYVAVKTNGAVEIYTTTGQAVTINGNFTVDPGVP